MNGCAGEGGGGPDHPGDGLGDVFKYLGEKGSNGIAMNGILVWMEIQQRSSSKNIVLSQAAYAFCDTEVDAARAALWKAAARRKDLIGEIIAHKSPGKKEKNLEDIYKAMMVLKEKDALPFFNLF